MLLFEETNTLFQEQSSNYPCGPEGGIKILCSIVFPTFSGMVRLGTKDLVPGCCEQLVWRYGVSWLVLYVLVEFYLSFVLFSPFFFPQVSLPQWSWLHISCICSVLLFSDLSLPIWYWTFPDSLSFLTLLFLFCLNNCASSHLNQLTFYQLRSHSVQFCK